MDQLPFTILNSRFTVHAISQELQRATQHPVDGQSVGLDDQVSVLAGMRQAPKLLLEVCFRPIEMAAPGAGLERCVQVDQDVGICDALPHVGYVGMFLRDVAALVASLLQAPYD